MRSNELEVELLEAPGELRIQHVTRRSWGCAWGLVAAITLPALAIGVVKILIDGWGGGKWWEWGGLGLFLAALVVVLASRSYGFARLDGAGIEVKGHGTNELNGDRTSLADIQAIELTTKIYGIAGSEESVTPGLHVVCANQRLCIIPRASGEQARMAMEAIARARPELRGRIRWESCNEAL
jgi:hypothetical protein